MRGLETHGSESRSSSGGPWLPWMVILLIPGNAFCQVQGLHPPQNVTLTSENFFVVLTWQPSLDFTNNTQYEVETRSRYNGSSDWTKVTSCQENKARQTQRCDLPSLPYNYNQARVRACDGARLSKWASSNLLQPYKDNIIGPLGLSLAEEDYSLTVVISLPPIPRADANFSKWFQDMQNIDYQMTLTEEGAVYINTPFRFTESTFKHTYGHLKHSTYYCVKAKATNRRTKESIQCIIMPGKPADRTVMSVIVTGLLLLSIMAGAFFKHHAKRNPSKPTFPKSLTFLTPEPNRHPPALSPVFCLEEDCVASVSAEGLPSEPSTALQLIPRGRSAQVWSAYCARGFDASSWSRDFLSSSQLEYLTDEDYRPDSELTGSSAHPPSSSTRLLLHDTGTNCISRNWECEIVNKRRPTGSSSSSRTDISLNSVKLRTMVDTLYGPETYLVRTDSDMTQGTPSQQTIESEECHEPHGFPKGSDFQEDSSLELTDMKSMTFSGYEFRQPILLCE